MRSTLAARLGGLVAAAAICGCNSTGPAVHVGLNGNFGSTTNYGWVGVTLRESGGIVSGTGWSSLTDKLQRGATVAGTYQAPVVQFDVAARGGGETWHFSGTFERDTLRGDFGLLSTPGFPIELTRIDTVPSGEYTLHLTGAITADFVGTPGFASIPLTNTFAIVLEPPGPPLYQVNFHWNGRDRPPAGVYPLSFGPNANPRGRVFRYDGSDPNSIELPAQRGTLWLDVSTRWAMIGRFDFTLTDPANNGTVTARANFSAGCVGSTC